MPLLKQIKQVLSPLQINGWLIQAPQITSQVILTFLLDFGDIAPFSVPSKWLHIKSKFASFSREMFFLYDIREVRATFAHLN